MKEIKFRGYWKCVNKYKYFDNLHLTEDAYKGEYGMFLPSSDGSVYLGHAIPEMFTGFKDCKGKDIYEGDLIGDKNEIDGKIEQSKLQVFWCEKKGAWMLDYSYKQDKSSGALLSEGLATYNYEVVGNIHEQSKEQILSNKK